MFKASQLSEPPRGYSLQAKLPVFITALYSLTPTALPEVRQLHLLHARARRHERGFGVGAIAD
ncbi:MAG: hypothetical protein R3B13_36795 [Polyangiaceae bacterium]